MILGAGVFIPILQKNKQARRDERAFRASALISDKQNEQLAGEILGRKPADVDSSPALPNALDDLGAAIYCGSVYQTKHLCWVLELRG